MKQLMQMVTMVPGQGPGPSVFPSGEPGVSGDFWVLTSEPPGKFKNIGVGSLSLLHWIFQT